MKHTQTRTTPLVMLIILGVMTTFGPLLTDMYVPALPKVQDSFMTTTSYVQLTLSFTVIGLALGQFIFGPLSDIFGRKKTVIYLLIIFTIASIAILFTTHIVAFIALRFIQGLMGGGAVVIAKATAGDIHEGNKLAQFLAQLLVVNGTITIIAPLIGGYLTTQFEWQYIFLFTALIAVVLILFTQFKMQEPKAETVSSFSIRAVGKDFKNLIKTPHFMIPMLLQGLAYVMLFSFSAASPFILQKIYHMSVQSFSLFLSINGIGLIIASQLTSFLLNKIDRHQLLRLFTLVQIIGVLAVVIGLSLQLPLWFLLISFFITICPVTAIGPLAFSIAMESRTGDSGNAASLLGLFQFLLGGVVSPLVGIQGQYSTLPYSLILIGTIIIVVLLHLYHSYLQRKQH